MTSSLRAFHNPSRWRSADRARVGAMVLGLVLGSMAGLRAQSPAETLKEGAVGPRVEALQRSLNARLVPTPALDVDGDFGKATREAVIRFQKSARLNPTGEADESTLKALGAPPPAAPDPPEPAVVNRNPPPKGPPDPLDGPPFVTAKTWAIVDRDGALIAGGEAEKPVDMASTTKIMTALVVLNLAKADPNVLSETVLFSQRADNTSGSTSGVRAGERLPVRELLYGLLLPSGNDAATAFAEHFGAKLDGPGGADPYAKFIAEMNRTAASLGLSESRFQNPHGLTAPGHRTSARDLAKLAAIALKDPIFAEVVSTAKHGSTVVDAEGHERNVVWSNTNNLLATEGYDGVKTGTTDAAGYCLVASGRRGEDRLIVVILGATSGDARYVDARNLFRWAWNRRIAGGR